MSFAFLPLYTGDYLRDTQHLSCSEHGIFLKLLMHCWDQRGPAPLDERKLSGIVNARSTDEIEALRRVLVEFFTRMDDGYYNHRMQREIERAEAISGVRSIAGKLGYLAKAKHLPSKSQATAKQEPLPPPPPPPLQPKGLSQSLLSQAPGFPTETRLALVADQDVYAPPDCPHKEILALWAEVLPAMPQHNPSLWRGTRADHLRARWRETAVEKKWASEAEGLVYMRKLFAWVGNSRFLTGRTQPKGDKPSFVAELAWLVYPQNWAKVIEGKYHTETA